jgi:hypothetical protein
MPLQVRLLALDDASPRLRDRLAPPQRRIVDEDGPRVDMLREGVRVVLADGSRELDLAVPDGALGGGGRYGRRGGGAGDGHETEGDRERSEREADGRQAHVVRTPVHGESSRRTNRRPRERRIDAGGFAPEKALPSPALRASCTTPERRTGRFASVSHSRVERAPARSSSGSAGATPGGSVASGWTPW